MYKKQQHIYTFEGTVFTQVWLFAHLRVKCLQQMWLFAHLRVKCLHKMWLILDNNDFAHLTASCLHISG